MSRAEYSQAINRWQVCTGRSDWETPQRLFDQLDAEFHYEYTPG